MSRHSSTPLCFECQLLPLARVVLATHWELAPGELQSMEQEREINSHLPALHGCRGVQISSLDPSRSLHSPVQTYTWKYFMRLSMQRGSWVGLQHSEACNCANASNEHSLISSSNWTVLQHTEALEIIYNSTAQPRHKEHNP
ncbi:hypothetical protein EK904_009953 [Melospiza melodia maxima]|nr:hypothetical protein EK904_009953 [Melospiza melodia maxima]